VAPGRGAVLVVPAVARRGIGGIIEDLDQVGGRRIASEAEPQAVVVA
jgi:hypothetical protein